MTILIADDAQVNLNAAKQAASQFPEHTFLFTSSAEEAIGLIESVDCVISDLFFEGEIGTSIAKPYAEYVAMIHQDSPLFSEYIKNYALGHYQAEKVLYAKDKLQDVLTIMQTGSLLQLKLIRLKDQYSVEQIHKWYEKFPIEFPLGGVLILKSAELKKHHCLISNIHYHSTNAADNTSAVDGNIVLMPLIEKAILSSDQVKSDGLNCLNYMGKNEIDSNGGSKTVSTVWAEAIRRVLAQ